eukprot:360184_1
MAKAFTVRNTIQVVSRYTLLYTPKLFFCSNVNVIEQWTDIPNCSNYQISSFGNIYNKKFNRFINVNYEMFKKHNRRAHVRLPTDQGESKNFLLARLVLLSFKLHPNSDNLQANHIDG